MNGATTDPCAKIRRPPKTTITNIIGNNQNFFLTFKNWISSLKNSILKLIIK